MLGVIGGVGPRATSKFYLDLVRKHSTLEAGKLPEFILANASLDKGIEDALVGEGNGAEHAAALMLDILREKSSQLKNCGCTEVIVICNTLQCAAQQVCAEFGLRLVDFRDSVIEEVSAAGWDAVCVVSGSRAQSDMSYETKLCERGVTVRRWTEAERSLIARDVLGFVQHERPSFSPPAISILRRAAEAGQGILLACTDIFTTDLPDDVRAKAVASVDVATDLALNAIRGHGF